MRARWFIVAMMSLVVTSMMFVGNWGHIEAQSTEDDRLGALETQVAELQATVAALTGEETSSSLAPASTAGPLETAVPAAAAAPSASGTGNLGGNAFEVLPSGNAGELAVVSYGFYDGMSLPVLLRNTTDGAFVRVSVSVSVRDSAGNLLAVGEVNDVKPARLEPGSYAFGSAYFDFATFPSDATFEFVATGEAADAASFIGQYDLTVQDASYLGDRIVGTAVNDQPMTLQGPFSVDAACFGPDGSLLGIANDYAPAETADSGATVPFQVSLFSVPSCDIFLIGASGWDF